MKRIIIVKSPRKDSKVSLGLVLESDLPILLEGMNNLETTKFLLAQPPFYENQEREWIQNLYKNAKENVVFMILYHEGEDVRPIGTIGLHKIDYANGFATSGCVIYDESLRGQGIGTEAKMLQLYYAFHVLGLRKVTSEVLGFNARSARYLEKSGYVKVGLQRAHRLREGKYQDIILLEVFHEDWKPLWKAYVEK